MWMEQGRKIPCTDEDFISVVQMQQGFFVQGTVVLPMHTSAS